MKGARTRIRNVWVSQERGPKEIRSSPKGGGDCLPSAPHISSAKLSRQIPRANVPISINIRSIFERGLKTRSRKKPNAAVTRIARQKASINGNFSVT